MSDLILAYAAGVKASGIAPVRLGSQTVNAQCPIDLTVAAGDPVLVAQVGALWFITGRYFTTGVATAPDGALPEPPVAPAARSGTSTFRPLRTVSYRAADAFAAGWRTDTDDLFQGEVGSNGSHFGCAFYGDQVATLSGATVTRAWVKARRRSSGGDTAARTVTMWRVGQSAKPAGPPTFSNAFAGPALAWGETVTRFIIPNAAAQALVDGDVGGLGIHAESTPYVILDGRDTYSGSLALSIEWSRS